MKETLSEIFKRHANYGKDVGCGDKNSTHSYTDTYDKVLAPYREGCNFLEIGLALGHSIRMFDEYFSNSNLFGIDISLMFGLPEKSNNSIQLIEADATRSGFLDILGDTKFDVVLDDADHTHQSQLATFDLLKGRMNPGGIYIIEDILNLEASKKYFLEAHPNCEIIDLRKEKGRFDDVIIIYRF